MAIVPTLLECMISTNKSYNGKPQSLQKVFLIFFPKNLNKHIYSKNKEKVSCT